MTKTPEDSNQPSTSKPKMRTSRRGFIQATAATVAGGYLTSTTTPVCGMFSGYRSVNEQPVVGFIGTGIRYHTYLGKAAMGFGPSVGVADVDGVQAGRALQVCFDVHREKKRPLDLRAYSDYRSILDNKAVDVVVIASPDHWHTKMAIDAMRAGKDVYCEKPLTLTIREGQQIYKVMKETGRVFQVGTQQRSEFSHRFVKAAGIAREGRVGKIKTVTAAIGGSRASDAIPVADVPKSLDWDKWLGQAPLVDYREAATITDQDGWGAGHPFGRGHRYYRWWYEYSGGKLTDWGAHHVDVGLWAMDRLGEDAGKVVIDPLRVEHPVPFVDGMPTKDDRFNCATGFKVQLTFEDGLVMNVVDSADNDETPLGFGNGIMFEGEKGRYFVNRGKLTGKAAEALKDNPLDEATLKSMYASGKVPTGEGEGQALASMKSFMDCVKSRETPSSDVFSHNKSMNICHGINIAMRLGRKLTWDTKAETFVDDAQADTFIEREQRAGYEIDA